MVDAIREAGFVLVGAVSVAVAVVALFFAVGIVLAAVMYLGKAAEWCLGRMELTVRWFERTLRL
jgi:hypothetical protein